MNDKKKKNKNGLELVLIGGWGHLTQWEKKRKKKKDRDNCVCAVAGGPRREKPRVQKKRGGERSKNKRIQQAGLATPFCVKTDNGKRNDME